MQLLGGGGQSLSLPPRHSAHAVDLSSNEPLSRLLYARRAVFSALHRQTQSRTYFRTPQGNSAC